MSRATLSGAICVLQISAAACLTAVPRVGPEHWQRAGASEEEAAIDDARCVSASMVPASLVGSGGNVMATELDVFHYGECMRQQGWEPR